MFWSILLSFGDLNEAELATFSLRLPYAAAGRPRNRS